jgi:hypothetical protein
MLSYPRAVTDEAALGRRAVVDVLPSDLAGRRSSTTATSVEVRAPERWRGLRMGRVPASGRSGPAPLSTSPRVMRDARR